MNELINLIFKARNELNKPTTKKKTLKVRQIAAKNKTKKAKAKQLNCKLAKLINLFH